MRTFSAIACALMLAGCGGGGGSSNIPSAPRGGSSAQQAVNVALIIPLPTTSSGARHPAFVSAATNGAILSVTGATSVSATVDLSTASTACTVTGGQRTCTISLTVPVGQDVFSIKTYDAAPVNGAIPASAHLLGQGSAPTTVVAGQTINVPLFIGGVIASFGGTVPAFSSVPADGTPHGTTIVLAPADFANQPITAGSNDPYANPISISITEHGGSGHASVLLNGVVVGTTATLTHSSDVPGISYDGGGTPGYYFTVSASASGVATQTAQISPMFVALNNVTKTTLALNGSATNLALSITEASAPNTQTYTATATNCTNIATVSSVSGSGASASFTVSGGTQPSATGCTIKVSDNLSNALTLATSNTPITGGVPVAGTSVTEYPVTAATGPYGITVGPDGNIWFTEQNVSKVGAMSTSGALLHEYLVASSSLYGITTGSDGALWIPDQNQESVDRITTGGVVTLFGNSPLGCPQGITSAADGTLWVANSCASIWNMTIGGTITTFLSLSNPTSIVQGPDGAIWFTDGSNIDRYDPLATTLTQAAVPGGASAQYITAGPDNAVWFTAQGASGIVGRVPMNGGGTLTASTVATLNAGSTPRGITAGIDNAVWYVDSGLNLVGRVSIAAGNAVSTYPIPTLSSGAQEITRGPDGTLWFTEHTAARIGHVVP